MQYRKFRCTDREVSALGMGVMRLPMDEDYKVDEDTGVELIRYAIDKGINYIDTGYTYHGGKSEQIIGRALKDGYRERVLIADKLPIWLVRSEGDVEKFFEEQMTRLGLNDEQEEGGSGCIDMYLVHNIIPTNWKKTKEFKVLPFLEKQKAAGRIKHIGFSFHGGYELFKEVIDSYKWDFCQIQLNYLDKDEQAGLRGLEYARERGVDVIVMEPLKGGRITDRVPESVQKLWDRAISDGIIEEDRTPARTAFGWVAAQPGVKLVLSGMGTKEQIDENVDIFSDPRINLLSADEEKVIGDVAEEYNRLFRYQCTGCEYCMPCEKKLNIPGIIEYLNNWYAFDKNPSTGFEYSTWIADGHHASDCIACGKCEEKCPQHLPIVEIMKEASQQFGR